MPGLTLLNIDRERDQLSTNPHVEIREIILEIENFIKSLQPNPPSARLVPLKMKLRVLQDAVSQFGSDGTISVQEKQQAIMGLHPELMMLTNELGLYSVEFQKEAEVCMNFLLNHLCSTAASDAKSQVIGVSNVMAQVLSSDMQIIPLPNLTLHPSDPKYFNEFAKVFNSMLTTAGLFSAPVLGLPDIPISALGGWSDQALEQFAIINQFVRQHFNTQNFYNIDKMKKATPFDTTTDILSFYVYENEFLAALLARADLLSGLEFKITENNQPVRLQAVEDITRLLGETIEANCIQIENVLKSIDELYQNGQIDRNEKPEDHPHLMTYRTEARIWRQIANFAKTMVDIFEEYKSKLSENFIYKSINLDNLGTDLPPLDDQSSSLQMRLYNILRELINSLNDKFPTSKFDQINFMQSSDFTEYKEFLQYIITIVGANDVLLRSSNAWTPWLLKNFGHYFLNEAFNFNPIGSMEVAVMLIIVGLMNDTRKFVDQGLQMLNALRPNMDFQLHHLASIEVFNILLTNEYSNYPNLVGVISDTLMGFLQEYEVNPNSMLFQKINLYLGMLMMYEESATLPENAGKHRFLRKENERFVAFDPFSWLQLPRNFPKMIPYLPLNTVLDNLNAG